MEVRCGGCQRVLPEPEDERTDHSEPCGNCGSVVRLFAIHVEDTVGVGLRELVRCKQRRPGHKKPIAEVLRGDDLERRSGRWIRKDRVIDRERDWYSEQILNPDTGQIIHQRAEPLSEHRGHGSARTKSGRAISS